MEKKTNKKTGAHTLNESDKKFLKLGVEKREKAIKDNKLIKKDHGV